MAVPQARVETQARPAEPLLASEFVSDEELDGLLGAIGSVGVGKRKEEGRLGTGVKSLDDALNGVLDGGGVVGISEEVGAGGSEFCRTLLVKSLLQYDNSTAAVIDTTGNFDILRLYTLIVSQLQRNPDVLASLRLPDASSGSAAKVEDVAAKVLDRVKIMRVFDFVGVREAIGEVRDELEGRRADKSVGGVQEKERVAREELPVVQAPPKRTVVADSEDEDDDEEMLFDSEATITAPVQNPEPGPSQQPEPDSTHQEQKSLNKSANRGKIKFLLIDNLAQVFNPLLKKDYIQANALASPFLQSLTNLTRTHTLHTILIDPSTTPRPPSPARQQGNQPPQQTQQPPPSPSMFASNTTVPSLTNVLARYVDVSLLVTRMPRKKMDARVYYSDAGGVGGNRGVVKKRGVEMVSVLEVVNDRWEGRGGAWGTFVEGEGEGGLRDVG